ncbi:peptidase S8/S53 domain-containing protein, partial [Catenaria anguillulae PL171]
GRGIKIGVVDTGIDWKHPAFAEPGKTCETFKGPGCRVLYGHDFVGDAYDSNNEAAVPQPDNDPMDCNGHGTHCAGISGGKDERIEGVAPGAVFGAYRIFGCEGSTSTEIILAALEQSYQDGMSVINMSLGGGRVTDDYPTAQAVDVLSDNGVYTMSAVGNSGTGGISWVSAPGVASRGIGVASFDNTHVLAQGADVTGAGDFKQLTFAYSDAGSKFDADVPQPIIRSPNAPTAANDGCDPFPADHFKGGVALVRRGACAFTVKGVNAVNAGATGVIIYNNVPGDMAGGVVDPAQLKAPIAFISGKSGEALYAAAAKPAEVKVTFKKDLVAVPSATAGLPSGFSSWGLTQNLQMKPDVGAPGTT